MKVLWIAVLICAGAVLVLALTQPGGISPGRYCATVVSDNPLNGSRDNLVDNLLPLHTGRGSGNTTALFSKYVASGNRYIVVSLYSGDTADPISVTVITPDKTLGPFYDESDGIIDGRIDLKISSPDNLTTGLWKFLVHSNKNISYGSLENLSWIRTGNDDHKADE
ncbi:MAG: hypothetical protein PHT99_01945 [Methanoregula sp.]|nr:hypothetical protein [Methanoregula sp.]